MARSRPESGTSATGVILLPAPSEALRVRWVISPLDSAIVSLREAAGVHPDAPAAGWKHLVSDRVSGLDLEPLVVFTSGSIVPAALNPVLASRAPSIEQQLVAIRSASSDQIRADLATYYPTGMPAAYQSFVDNPRRALARVCDALGAYWNAVMRPLWPIVKTVLEREVLVRSLALANGSVRSAVGGAHPQVAVTEQGLRLHHPGRPPARGLGDRTLTLVPVIGGPRRLAFDMDGPGRPWLSYSVSDAGSVWGDAPLRAPNRRLCALIGTRRAQILAQLARPASLALLANDLGTAPSTLSEHLFALSGSGLVDRFRVGSRTYFRLTRRGEHLMDLFEPTAPVQQISPPQPGVTILRESHSH